MYQGTKPKSKKRKFPSACKTGFNPSQISPEDIYTMIEKNLEDDNYPIASKYFKKLVAREDHLIKTDIRLKKRVRDYRCMLVAIVENIKSAEDAYRTLNDQKLTLRLLIQTLHMIQTQDQAFSWLVKEMFKIILNISEDWEESCIEDLSRIYFEYGVALSEKNETLEKAITYMEKSLAKCKGTTWYTNEINRNFLYEDVSTKLCETFLHLAKIKSKKNPEISADLAERAAQVIHGIGRTESASLYCEAKIRQSEYLSANQKFQEAFEVLNDTEKEVLSIDDNRNMCEFNLWLGICLFKINPKNKDISIKKLEFSLQLSDEHNFADLKAETLLNLGKIHSMKSATHGEARECFIQAKELFEKQRDFENEKLAKYLMAQLRAYQNFPNYLRLIQKSTKDGFCYMYDLLMWQQKLTPYWNTDGKLNHHHDDPIQCLLDRPYAVEVSDSNFTPTV